MTLSCGKGEKGTIEVNAGVLPLTHGENILSLISDSGITRYRLETQVWDIYSNDTNPYWHFPEGVYMEQFDSVYAVVGSIKADTAYFFEKKELWRLIGNVHIHNRLGWEFETAELFWNRKEPPYSLKSVYTDSVVRIDKNNGERTVVSQGMKSNQDLSRYILYKSYMEAVIDENDTVSKNDSLVPHPSTSNKTGHENLFQ
jgi:hypothetical protein